MTTNPVRVAPVGAGFFARFHLNAWRRLGDAVLAILAHIVSQLRSDAPTPD